MIGRALLAAVPMLVPVVCDAQAIRGVVVDQRGEPLPAVVVLLLDAKDSTVARALTNALGEYRLLAPAAGSFRLRTLRIGYRPTTTDLVAVRVAAETQKRIAVAEVPSALDTIRVRGRNACRVRPDSAMATFAIWEQARAALMATQLTAAGEGIATRVVVYRRRLDKDEHRVLEQTQAVSSARDARIWKSVSADSFRTMGYVHADVRSGVSFYAPDLDVLLSAEFVEDHCFRLDEKSDDDRVGIAFEPTNKRRRIPEIRGTLWVDRKSSELRRLEFTYTNVARELEAAGPGGALQFARLADGSWAIASWHIRIPLVETRRMGGARSIRQRGVETEVHAVQVSGGDLAMVLRGKDTLWSQPPMAFRGQVVDSTTNRVVAGAWLTLGGTRLGGLTDSAGRFVINGALPGEYVVDVRTPSLDSIGVAHSAAVNLADSSRTEVVLVPNATSVLAGLCGDSGQLIGSLIGTVIRRSDSLPRADARVVAEWREQSTEGRQIAHSREARSALDGKYRFCGLPLGVAFMVRADSDSLRADSTTVRLAGDRAFSVVDLWLDRPTDPGAILEGNVLSDVNAQPIPDVEVALPAVSRNAFTDARGRFRIAGIPAGTHSVIARRLGYRRVDMTIAFAPKATVERQILLSRIVVLDTVAVKATMRDQMMREFYENRRLGLGKFWTRAELAKLEGLPMSAVLSQINGSMVLRGRGNYAWMIRHGRGIQTLGNSTGSNIMPDYSDQLLGAKRGCYATVWVDNVRVYSGRDEEPLFNINSITPDQIEAIEYYAGPAQTPARYAAHNTVCGALVIWTRRSFAPDSSTKKP